MEMERSLLLLPTRRGSLCSLPLGVGRAVIASPAEVTLCPSVGSELTYRQLLLPVSWDAHSWDPAAIP